MARIALAPLIADVGLMGPLASWNALQRAVLCVRSPRIGPVLRVSTFQNRLWDELQSVRLRKIGGCV